MMGIGGNTVLFNQTDFRPKIYVTDLLTPQKYQGCKFSTQKSTSDPFMYAASNPPWAENMSFSQANNNEGFLHPYPNDLFDLGGGGLYFREGYSLFHVRYRG